jgi:hypothetical protein
MLFWDYKRLFPKHPVVYIAVYQAFTKNEIMPETMKLD